MAKRQVSKINEFGQIWDSFHPDAAHEGFGNLWLSWVAWMLVLEDAELSLAETATYTKGKNGELIMPLIYGVRAMLLGFALECGLKALWLRRGNKLIVNGEYRGVTGANDHNLLQLANATEFVYSAREKHVLASIPTANLEANALSILADASGIDNSRVKAFR